MKKIALVTGAASGIGLACAERLARDGCTVVIADVNEQAGNEHARRLGGTFVRSDLTKRAGCKDLPGVTWLRFGVWLLVGLALYACYGRRHSRLR